MQHKCSLALPLCFSLSPTFTLSDGNTRDSLLAKSPDQSCTFSQPPYTHSHYTPTTITHTLPTSWLLTSICHWLLLSYRPPPSFWCSQYKPCLCHWFWQIPHSVGLLSLFNTLLFSWSLSVLHPLAVMPWMPQFQLFAPNLTFSYPFSFPPSIHRIDHEVI